MLQVRLRIRPFKPGDEASLMRVFRCAVHGIASKDYSPEQVNAWAPADMDLESWGERIRPLHPFVAELDGDIAGYADLQPSGHIEHFFVSGEYPRRGVGSALMAKLHESAQRQGISSLTADVSLTAEPFFARHGFVVIERKLPIRRGVVLQNAFMRKQL